MVELVDTLHSGCSVRTDVQVRVLSWVHDSLLRFTKSAIFICVLFFSGIAVAQQVVVHDTTYRFVYMVSKSTTTNPVLTHFLNDLSQKTKIGDPYFKYTFAVNLYTTQLDTSQSQINCSISKESIQGNIDYLGFDIGEKLFPNKINVIIAVDVDGKNQKFPIQGSLVNKQTNLERILISNSTSKRINPTLTIIDNVFDEQWQTAVALQMHAIETYHQADSLISSWDTLIRKINLEKTELIPLLDYELDDLMTEIRKFNDLNLVSLLNLSQNDPEYIAQKITEINIKAAQKQVLLNEYLMNIDQRFVIDARKYKERGNILQSIYLYNKAIEYHRYNVVALNELAKLYYEIGNLESAAKLIKQIYTTTYPDDYQYQKSHETGDFLYKKIVNQGNDMLVAQNFAEAIKIYEYANIFCDSIPEPICNISHKMGITKAKNGIYLSYLSVIEKAIKGNLFSIAQNYSMEAHKYQQLNIKEIPSDEDLQKLVDLIVSKQVAQSLQLIQSKQFIKALSRLESADSIGSKFRPDFKLQVLSEYRSKAANGALLELTNEVDKALKLQDRYVAQKNYDKATQFKQQYQQFITDTSSLIHAYRGIKALDYNSLVNDGDLMYRLDLFQNALEKYIEAKTLEQKYQLTPVKNLDSTISGMSKPLIFNYLSVSRQKIWGNDFFAAKQFYFKADTLAHSSLLMNDSAVKSDLEQTKLTLDRQWCISKTKKYSDLFENFTLLKQQRLYGAASQNIDSILVMLKIEDNCILKDRLNSEDILFVKMASAYQQNIQDARYLGTIDKMDEALQKYYEADSIYRFHPLDSNLIKRESLSSIFIFVTSGSSFIKVCEWLYAHGKFEDSEVILSQMKQKGVPDKTIKYWQKSFEKATQKRMLEKKTI